MTHVSSLTHLDRLEAESIHILREVASEFQNPVMMYSVGKDSSVLLHLLVKAFYPARPPIPLLHVDTGWKFGEMIAFRDRRVKETGVELHTYTNPEGLAQQGNARWSITGSSGPVTSGVPGTGGLGTVESGVLERANVDITEELVGLITAQRNFQANAKAIETANAITQTVTNMRT